MAVMFVYMATSYLSSRISLAARKKDETVLKNMGAYAACLDVVFQFAEFNKFTQDQKIQLCQLGRYMPFKCYRGHVANADYDKYFRSYLNGEKSNNFFTTVGFIDCQLDINNAFRYLFKQRRGPGEKWFLYQYEWDDTYNYFKFGEQSGVTPYSTDDVTCTLAYNMSFTVLDI